MNWLHGAWAVFQKDLRIELRTRVGVSSLVLFVLTALFVSLYGIGSAVLPTRVQAALLWIVVLFSAALGMGRAFVSEEEQQTALLLRLHARPLSVYVGKLAFNFVLLSAVNLIATFVFVLLLNKSVANPGLALVVILLGSLALAGTTTLLSALVIHAGGVGLLPLLMFPLLLPLLGALVTATSLTFVGGFSSSVLTEQLITVGAFAGVTITASVLLFEHVWND